jgi:F0F1-type ATP synthase membrane subunit a
MDIGVLTMSEVLHRYRLVIITLALLLFAAVLWLLLSRQETAKIPSKGVFVVEAVSRTFAGGR